MYSMDMVTCFCLHLCSTVAALGLEYEQAGA